MENKTAEREKRIAVDFFYWWHNQPGTNTEEGFESYRKSERYKMLDVSITVEADVRDEQLSIQCAEMKKENERLRRNIGILMSWIGKEHPKDALRLIDEMTKESLFNDVSNLNRDTMIIGFQKPPLPHDTINKP